MSAQLVHSTLPSWPSPAQSSPASRWKICRHVWCLFAKLYCTRIYYFLCRDFHISYIIYSPPLCLSPSLSLSVSGAFSLALYKFNYIRNVRATIENGFATLAMCSASFGQLLMVLSLPPFHTLYLFHLRFLSPSLSSSRASHVLHAQQFQLNPHTISEVCCACVRVCVHGYCIWEIYFNANRTAISEAILTPWVATRSEETR